MTFSQQKTVLKMPSLIRVKRIVTGSLILSESSGKTCMQYPIPNQYRQRICLSVCPIKKKVFKVVEELVDQRVRRKVGELKS